MNIQRSSAHPDSAAWLMHPDDNLFRFFLWDVDYEANYPHLWDMEDDSDPATSRAMIAEFKNWETAV